jgi:predicted RNA-binding Zn ribbon-like protein
VPRATPQPRRWLLPDEPAPVRLTATIWADTTGLHDDFAGPSDVDAWLDAVGLGRQGAETTPAEFRRAVHLRDALRRLVAYVTDDERPATTALTVEHAIDTINAAAAKLPPTQLQLTKDGLHLAVTPTASPITAALAQIARETQQLVTDNGSSLRACYAPGCVLYFTKTHPRREWCSIACGNRTRAARHYQSIRKS